MAANTPISVDFLSDPSALLASLRKVEIGIMRVESRVGGLGVAFAVLNRGLPTNAINAQITSINQQVAALTNVVGKLSAQFNTASVSAARMAQQTARVNARTPAGSQTPGGSGGGGGGGGNSVFLAGRGMGGALVGAAAIAGMQQTTMAAVNLEQALAGVAAVGQLDKTGKEFQALVEAVKGGSKQFTSTEKAEGLRELVAAGMSAKEAGASLSDTLEMATAGEMKMGRAAEIMVAAMSAFKFTAKDTGLIVDTLTAAANASPASIDDMGEALKYVAPVGQALKLSIQDVSAALAILAKNGVKSGIAGRGLGSVLARLIAPSRDAMDALNMAGISAASLDPMIVGLRGSLEALSKVDQKTLVKIFGSENLDISNILASNADGFKVMREEMQDVTGVSKKFAEAVSETSGGRLKAMKNEVAELSAELGKLGTSMLNAFAPTVTGYVEGVVEDLRYLDEVTSRLETKTASMGEKVEAVFKAYHSATSVPDALDALHEAVGLAARIRTTLNSAPRDEMGAGDLAQLDKLSLMAVKLQSMLNESNADVQGRIYFTQWAKGAESALTIARVKFAELMQPEPLVGPEERANSRGKMKDEAKERASTMSRVFKDLEKEDELAKKRVEYETEIAELTAQNSGNTAEARRLEIVKETAKVQKDMNLEEAEAEALATSMVNARRDKKGNKSFNTVADSLQSMGGGGIVFGGGAGSVEDQQLRVQEQIRDGINGLGGTSGTGGAPGNGNTSPVGDRAGAILEAINGVLLKIETNTKRTGVLRVSLSGS